MIIDGRKLSNKIKEKLKKEIANYSIKSCLCVIYVGNDEASKIYIKNKEKACNYVGIDFKLIHFDSNVEEDTIINKIVELNNDDNINGIILQLPIEEHYNEKRIINSISHLKDVDGMTDINVGKSINNLGLFISCTAKGVMELLKSYKIKLRGKHVVLVGRSNLVGKPILQECLKKDATVTICHSKTKNLKTYTKSADILIVAVGRVNLIKEDMVKDDVIIIDVGINRYKNHICGDVSLGAKDKSLMYTPVPYGVGPMTVAMLLTNTLISYRNKNNI